MPKLTEQQINKFNANTRLYAESIAENVCDAIESELPEAGIDLDVVYDNLIHTIGKTVASELGEIDVV